MMSISRVFGPVPSRRLGRSLGVNNIPPKICTYSCVYCQLGRTLEMIADRRVFFDPEDITREVEGKILKLLEDNTDIDYITIVPDGEPTIDINLGKLLDFLKPLNKKLAVITNSTLLHKPDVRRDLHKADWVSVKVDSVKEKTWKEIDRPHGKIKLENILSGIRQFSQEYGGKLVTETMLVKDLNDDLEQINLVAEFIREIKPSTAYLSIPTRPPAEEWAIAPDESSLNLAYQVFLEHKIPVEYLIGYEGNEFASTGDIEDDLLSITSVHPMREDAIREYLTKAMVDFSVVEKMVAEEKLVVTEYQHNLFYLRRFYQR